MRDESDHQATFQLVLNLRGATRTTDLPIATNEIIQRLALEATLQDQSIVELVGEALVKAIKHNMVQKLLD